MQNNNDEMMKIMARQAEKDRVEDYNNPLLRFSTSQIKAELRRRKQHQGYRRDGN